MSTQAEHRKNGGLRTEVVENIVEESQGSKVISRALVPFVRPRQITFVGQGFLPNTRVYPFFEGKDISAYVTPASSTYTPWIYQSRVMQQPRTVFEEGAAFFE